MILHLTSLLAQLCFTLIISSISIMSVLHLLFTHYYNIGRKPLPFVYDYMDKVIQYVNGAYFSMRTKRGEENRKEGGRMG